MKEAHLLHRVIENATRSPELKISDGITQERGKMRRTITVIYKGKTKRYFVKPTDDQDDIERKIDELAAALKRRPTKAIDVEKEIKRSKAKSQKLVLTWLDQ